MKWQLIFLIFLLFPIISATCEEGQIDVNSAPLDELDIITGIGPAYAQRITDARPFNSVDDLIHVSGIGPVTLGNIKSQGFACVDGTKKEAKTEEETENEEIIYEEVVTKEIVEEEIIEEVVEDENKDPLELESVSLNTKVIKTDDSEESYNVYAIWGLVTFSILLVLLFMLSKLKEDKNEFS